MIAPAHAAITIALDTAKYRARRPEERRESIAYLLDRLLSGLEVAEEEFIHYGLRVTVRAAFKSEIIGD